MANDLPEVVFHPKSEDKNPRFSSLVYSQEKPESSGFGLTWEEGGKQQSDVFRAGDPLPGNISWQAPREAYASPLTGEIGEVVSVGPEYAVFEFNVPISDRYPEGRMRTRMNLGRTRGNYSERMEALRREAQEGEDSQYDEFDLSPEEYIERVRAASKTPFKDSKKARAMTAKEKEENARKLFAAGGYADQEPAATAGVEMDGDPWTEETYSDGAIFLVSNDNPDKMVFVPSLPAPVIKKHFSSFTPMERRDD